jgi:hypothetical protein
MYARPMQRRRRHKVPVYFVQSGLCRHPESKRGTFVALQDKPVRAEYGCIHHEPRVQAQGELLERVA